VSTPRSFRAAEIEKIMQSDVVRVSKKMPIQRNPTKRSRSVCRALGNKRASDPVLALVFNRPFCVAQDGSTNARAVKKSESANIAKALVAEEVVNSPTAVVINLRDLKRHLATTTSGTYNSKSPVFTRSSSHVVNRTLPARFTPYGKYILRIYHSEKPEVAASLVVFNV
jgi:hypothetical protein